MSTSSEPIPGDPAKPAPPEKDSELPVPGPYAAVTRLTRKRAASLNSEIANHPKIEDLALTGASPTCSPTSDRPREHVCLCQPDPKIPRPRNGA